jgi:hypothetical protein
MAGRKASIKPNWFVELAKGGEDLARIQPAGKKPLAPPPIEANEIPPFRGISRLPLLTRMQACDVIGCCLTHLDKQIRGRMIFPQPKGRRVMIPIEEIENYFERERLKFQRKHA